MKLLQAASEKIKNSPFIIPITTVFIIMLVVSLGLSWEDYSSSFYGYEAFPTAKANWWVVYLVALLPQIVQIGMAYVFIDDTQKRWAIAIAVIAHIVDISTDIWYKIRIAGIIRYELIPLAFMETEAIYTLGSELMLTVSFGMILQLFPYFWKELSILLTPLFRGAKRLFFWLLPALNDGRNSGSNTTEYRSGSNGNRVNIRPLEKSEHRPMYPDYNIGYGVDNSNLPALQKRRPGRPRKVETPEYEEPEMEEFNLERALTH